MSLEDYLPERREEPIRFKGKNGEIVGVWCPACREVHDEPTCDQRPLSELSADQLDALRIHEAEKNALQQRNVRRALDFTEQASEESVLHFLREVIPSDWVSR